MRALGLIALAMLSGCLKGGEFKCASDLDCDRGGQQGTCQDVGYCSFADSSCASGQRFAELSGSVSNTCVGPIDTMDGPPDNPPGQFSIGGTISGLSGTVMLEKNGGDTLTRTTDGAFTFAGTLPDTADYLVNVSAQPSMQTCLVSNGTGQVAAADVTNIEIACGGISSATIACATGTSCAVGTEYCCLDPALGNGTCNTQNQCGGKHVECDSKDDCAGANICCATYSNQNAFRGAQCQTENFCIPVSGVKVEIWCDPLGGASACPLGKTCTGSPIVPNPGYKTCI